MLEHLCDAEFRTPLEWIELVQRKFRLVDWANQPSAAQLLRTNPLKAHREALDAALFCSGVEQLFQVPVHISMTEKEDFDFLVVLDPNEKFGSWQVQMKEFPPDDIAPRASLETILISLRKYRNPELTITIKNSRRDSDMLRIPAVADTVVKQIWIFGILKPGTSRGFLFGDLRHPPERRRMIEFTVPEVAQSMLASQTAFAGND